MCGRGGNDAKKAPISSPTPVMQAATRWARASCPFIVVEIGWSSTGTGWTAAATGVTTWPGLKWAPRPHHHRWAEWLATLLTSALPVLERLAARHIDPCSALRVLASVELQRGGWQRRRALLRSATQLRKDAAMLDKAAGVLRRHHERLVDQTPMAEVRVGERGPFGRRLYSWAQEILGWVAAELRAVPPSGGRIQEQDVLLAASALRRVGLTVPEIGALLGSARLSSYLEPDDERTKGWLRRARLDPRIQTAARQVAALGRNVPANVPATSRQLPQTSQRRPTRKRKTPR